MSKELNPAVRSLADDLKPIITLDNTTGVAEAPGAEDVFAKHLPEGVTIETVKVVQDSLLTYAAAQTLANGELQRDAMLENKDLASGSLKTKIGYSAIESSYHRRKSGTAMGKPWEKFGVTNTDVTLGVGRKGADLKAVVNYLGEDAQSVFAN